MPARTSRRSTRGFIGLEEPSRARVFATAIFAEISTGFAPLHAMSGRSKNIQPIAERILGDRPFESLISTTFEGLQTNPLNL
jgi:hypothetical protein